MSVVRLHPIKSNTLYSDEPFLNTGKDQILELTANKLNVSRILLDFDKTEILSTINGANNWTAFLKLYAADESGLPEKTDLDIHNIYSPWKEGTGNYLNIPASSSGSNWIYNDSAASSTWIEDLSELVLGSYASNNPGGGNWFESPFSSEVLTKGMSSDLDIDVTTNISSYLSTQSSGILIKLNSSHEINYNESINIKYFSEDTNTIYRPVLEIRKPDHTYVPSGSVMNNTEINVVISNPITRLSLNDVVIFKVGIKDQHPVKTYSNVYGAKHNLVISDNCYWQLRDVITGEIVINGSPDSTRISTSNGVNFFYFNTKNLYKHRYYTFDIFITVGNTIQKFTPKYIFNIDG